MAECALLNLGSCLPQKFFEFFLNILNAPITPFLNLTLDLFSEPINIQVFFSFWVIIVYMLSMFYSLLLLGTGFSFMISGHDVAKRENAKQWLRNIVIMIILIQASFFIYQLAIDLSSTMTSATLTLLDENFFTITATGANDLALSILFALLYLLTLIITSVILVIRYAFVSLGVVFMPMAIFFYFFNPLKQYGSLILNFLGTAIFITFFDAVFLAGFAQLVGISIFEDMKIIVLISAFMVINIFMSFLMFFSIVKAALSAYSDIKRGIKL